VPLNQSFKSRLIAIGNETIQKVAVGQVGGISHHDGSTKSFDSSFYVPASHRLSSGSTQLAV
jgi:hypothetical protein